MYGASSDRYVLQHENLSRSRRVKRFAGYESSDGEAAESRS